MRRNNIVISNVTHGLLEDEFDIMNVLQREFYDKCVMMGLGGIMMLVSWVCPYECDTKCVTLYLLHGECDVNRVA